VRLVFRFRFSAAEFLSFFRSIFSFIEGLGKVKWESVKCGNTQEGNFTTWLNIEPKQKIWLGATKCEFVV
jgi:hypothetical protein